MAASDMTRDEMVGAFSEAHDSLLIAADTAMTRGDPHNGAWGLRDVLAHVAAWEAEALLRLPLLLSGAADESYDVDAFNAAAVASLGDLSIGAVRARFDETHARLLTLLNGLDETSFARGAPVSRWVRALIRHDLEHARTLGGPSTMMADETAPGAPA